jgi:hypothetical protein
MAEENLSDRGGFPQAALSLDKRSQIFNKAKYLQAE